MKTSPINKKSLYWICQVGGWLFFIGLNIIFIGLNNNFNAKIATSFFLLFLLGIIFSHLYRELIVRADWLRMNRFQLIPLVLISTILLSASLHLTRMLIESALGIAPFAFSQLSTLGFAVNVINMAFVFFFWSLIYFLVHYIENYKKAEIENLKWAASINEIELNKLKSQLNPHFIFNSMNSIRALVDENPLKAKDSITQLSNILRNTLLMGKKKVISFEEEMKIVKDYLELEATRFEERLTVNYDLAPGSEQYEIPPLMVQTLAENGIKHGISKLSQGGSIEVSTKLEPGKMTISIVNSGSMNGLEPGTGFGIKSTQQRLALLYGDKGSFKLTEDKVNNRVIATVIVPDMKVI